MRAVSYEWESTPALWSAQREDYDGGDPRGFGRTKEEALAELLDVEEGQAEERERRLREINAGLLSALGALGVIGHGYCFCSTNRSPNKITHQPECREARAAIAAAENK